MPGLRISSLKDGPNMGESTSMSLVRRASTILPAAAMVLGLASFESAASTTRMSVPANILKGASVTTGRAFYKTTIPEDSLAGIRLARPAREILVKWGNPSRITVGTVASEGATEGAAPTMPGPPYIPPGSGLRGQVSDLASTLSSMYGAAPPTPGEMPFLPGYGSPLGNLPPAGEPGAATGTTSVLTEEEVTWTYDLPNGITLEFVITEGIITQITVGGVGPWSLSRTRTGLQLGDTYKLVLWVCGYPERQSYVGRFLRVSYVNSNRALFTFLNNRLVGITIAMVPTEITIR